MIGEQKHNSFVKVYLKPEDLLLLDTGSKGDELELEGLVIVDSTFIQKLTVRSYNVSMPCLSYACASREEKGYLHIGLREIAKLRTSESITYAQDNAYLQVIRTPSLLATERVHHEKLSIAVEAHLPIEPFALRY